MSTEIEMYVVYDKPSDHPDNVVVRRFVVRADVAAPDEVAHAVVDTVEQARDVLRALGCINIGRQPEDEDQIAEVWV